MLARWQSATAVPVMLANGLMRQDASAPGLGPALRAFAPYLIVVARAFPTRIVYRLGTEIAHAHALGSYRLVERLGQGGMGEVWRAEHALLAVVAVLVAAQPIQHADGPLKPAPADPLNLFADGASACWIEDGEFVYGPALLDFDLRAYLTTAAPHLLPQVEASSHWAGHYVRRRRDGPRRLAGGVRGRPVARAAVACRGGRRRTVSATPDR